MTSHVRVSLGNEQTDRPHWMGVGAVALVGLACGLLVVLGLGRSLGDGNASPRAQANSSDSSTPAEARTAVPTDTTVSAIKEGAAGTGLPAAAASASPAGSESGSGAVVITNTVEPPIELPEAAPAEVPIAAVPSAPAPTSASHELVHGHIAYLRCEGVPLQDGPFPCPRDRRLEKQVWSALDRLPTCPLPPLGPGSDFELRVEFRTRGRHSFEVKPPRGSEALTNPVQACLANDLELVRTQLRPLLMTVLFRFELR